MSVFQKKSEFVLVLANLWNQPIEFTLLPFKEGHLSKLEFTKDLPHFLEISMSLF